MTMFYQLGSNWAASGHNARLYYHDDYDNKRIAAWCVGSWDDFKRNPYIQIDLGRTRNIQYIATQGMLMFYCFSFSTFIDCHDDAVTD